MLATPYCIESKSLDTIQDPTACRSRGVCGLWGASVVGSFVLKRERTN